jgi:hypothetical protein
MGDAGEGLIDHDARIQELMDARAQEKARRAAPPVRDPDRLRELESLRLARTELERQLGATAHAARRQQIAAALAEIDRRLNPQS